MFARVHLCMHFVHVRRRTAATTDNGDGRQRWRSKKLRTKLNGCNTWRLWPTVHRMSWDDDDARLWRRRRPRRRCDLAIHLPRQYAFTHAKTRTRTFAHTRNGRRAGSDRAKSGRAVEPSEWTELGENRVWRWSRHVARAKRYWQPSACTNRWRWQTEPIRPAQAHERAHAHNRTLTQTCTHTIGHSRPHSAVRCGLVCVPCGGGVMVVVVVVSAWECVKCVRVRSCALVVWSFVMRAQWEQRNCCVWTCGGAEGMRQISHTRGLHVHVLHVDRLFYSIRICYSLQGCNWCSILAFVGPEWLFSESRKSSVSFEYSAFSGLVEYWVLWDSLQRVAISILHMVVYGDVKTQKLLISMSLRLSKKNCV